VKRFKNFGYSRLYTALRTEDGAQPPGFTVNRKSLHNFITIVFNFILGIMLYYELKMTNLIFWNNQVQGINIYIIL